MEKKKENRIDTRADIISISYDWKRSCTTELGKQISTRNSYVRFVHDILFEGDDACSHDWITVVAWAVCVLNVLHRFVIFLYKRDDTR